MDSRLLVLAIVLGSAPALAHRMEVDFLRAGKAFKIEVFYPADGSAVREARVRVAASSGRVVAEGLTDEHGAFAFETGEVGPFTVVAEHGAHGATCEIPSLGRAAEDTAPGEDRKAVTGTKIRREEAPAVEIVSGLGAIFGAAGFCLAVLAWRRTARIRDQLADFERKWTGAP